MVAEVSITRENRRGIYYARLDVNRIGMTSDGNERMMIMTISITTMIK